MEEIKKKIKAGEHLSPQEEKELIKLGNITLLQRYVSKYPLTDEAEMELVKSGNTDAVKVYAKYYPHIQDKECDNHPIHN